MASGEAEEPPFAPLTMEITVKKTITPMISSMAARGIRVLVTGPSVRYSWTIESRRRSGGKRNAAKNERQINRDSGNKKSNRKNGGHKQKCSDRLNKGDADNLFSGACDFFEDDLPSDHNTGKALKKPD